MMSLPRPSSAGVGVGFSLPFVWAAWTNLAKDTDMPTETMISPL
jgi:hypothetical protein